MFSKAKHLLINYIALILFLGFIASNFNSLVSLQLLHIDICVKSEDIFVYSVLLDFATAMLNAEQNICIYE